eukprot:6077578-Prymnesium_polylepis.1
MRFDDLRKMLKASQHERRKRSYNFESAPPMASTISLQSFMGGGKGLGSRPRMYPKSMWKRAPFERSIKLSRWRSPTPRTYIATQ